ncbi:CBASS cGAMP-activated phospholipase [Thalassobacillus pellis]|uniref:CBASS cGAMP-activated phospholipase n=1 Tax=Thalassobacillus pellis TaxID=748008 RepID=UPI0019606D55|nr:CBASS cGAMP-activated phospholipase [Thalassobacillus pellis]MBM7553469.1 patatin-like phospholipase/acyl hydrolase [Thalassobacillus pellis]
MKMLCIDGGGIRGVMPIAVLQEIERELGQSVGESFDVIAGTSTGAIIAASTAVGKPMEDVLHSYKTAGAKIFMRQAKVGFFKSVYSDRYLRRLLKKAFGEVTLADISKQLLIPAVDITHGKPFIHRSNPTNRENDDVSIKLWDAVLSSCSAPIYFPPNNVRNRYLSIDGGLWANNPSLVCITEAVHHLKESLEDIRILSLGTGDQNIDFSIDSEKYWGVKQWLPFQIPSFKVTPKLLDLALNLSSESVSYHCQLLLRDNYLRINKALGGEVPFDDIAFMEEMIKVGKQVYDQNRTEIMDFLQG